MTARPTALATGASRLGRARCGISEDFLRPRATGSRMKIAKPLIVAALAATLAAGCAPAENEQGATAESDLSAPLAEQPFWVASCRAVLGGFSERYTLQSDGSMVLEQRGRVQARWQMPPDELAPLQALIAELVATPENKETTTETNREHWNARSYELTVCSKLGQCRTLRDDERFPDPGDNVTTWTRSHEMGPAAEAVVRQLPRTWRDFHYCRDYGEF